MVIIWFLKFSRWVCYVLFDVGYLFVLYFLFLDFFGLILEFEDGDLL